MAHNTNTRLPAKSRLQIALEYGINYKTLSRRLKKYEIDLPAGLVYPKEQKVVYSRLGYPNQKLRQSFNSF